MRRGERRPTPRRAGSPPRPSRGALLCGRTQEQVNVDVQGAGDALQGAAPGRGLPAFDGTQGAHRDVGFGRQLGAFQPPDLTPVGYTITVNHSYRLYRSIGTGTSFSFSGPHGMLRRMGTTLGERLRECRLAAGMTQQDVWTRAGIPRTTYTDLEQGSVDNPTTANLSKIAAAIGVTVDHLLRGEEPPHSPVAIFLATPFGSSLSEHEKAHILSAARQRPYPDKPIDLAYLYALALAMKGHFAPGEVPEMARLNQELRPRAKKM